MKSVIQRNVLHHQTDTLHLTSCAHNKIMNFFYLRLLQSSYISLNNRFLVKYLKLGICTIYDNVSFILFNTMQLSDILLTNLILIEFPKFRMMCMLMFFFRRVDLILMYVFVRVYLCFRSLIKE